MIVLKPISKPKTMAGQIQSWEDYISLDPNNRHLLHLKEVVRLNLPLPRPKTKSIRARRIQLGISFRRSKNKSKETGPQNKTKQKKKKRLSQDDSG